MCAILLGKKLLIKFSETKSRSTQSNSWLKWLAKKTIPMDLDKNKDNSVVGWFQKLSFLEKIMVSKYVKVTEIPMSISFLS